MSEDELQIDWQQVRPTALELSGLWNSITLTSLDNWTTAAETFKEKVTETHCNGGIQLHKYKLTGTKSFDWFASRNRLEEINFLENILRHKDLQEYRHHLDISDNKPKIKLIKYWTDLYDLPGELARVMGLGGAYKKIDQRLAWAIATDFVKDELENRFGEFNAFDISIENANWFYDIAWDFSKLLFDKRNYELIFIDITDTD